jgi:hypothetical protein
MMSGDLSAHAALSIFISDLNGRPSGLKDVHYVCYPGATLLRRLPPGDHMARAFGAQTTAGSGFEGSCPTA